MINVQDVIRAQTQYYAQTGKRKQRRNIRKQENQSKPRKNPEVETEKNGWHGKTVGPKDMGHGCYTKKSQKSSIRS